MIYNGDTIDTDTELVYDIPELSGWDQFWRGPWGKVIAVLAIYAAWTLAVFCPAFIPYFISGMAWTAAGLGVSAAIAGYQSLRTGHGFWSGFGQALSNGWSCSFAFGIAISMATFGLSQAVQAISRALKHPLLKAKFAQSDYDEIFSSTGRKIYSDLAGQKISSINDLAAAIKSGIVNPADIPVEYIINKGNTIILNTRTSVALTRAGIPVTAWNAVNVTGDIAAQIRLTAQLARNGLTSSGTTISFWR